MSNTDWADRAAADALVNVLWMSEEEQSKALVDVAKYLRAAKQAGLEEAERALLARYKTLMRDLPPCPRPERFDARALAISGAIDIVRALKEQP